MKKYGKVTRKIDCFMCEGTGQVEKCSCGAWHHDDTYYCVYNECGGTKSDVKCIHCDGTGKEDRTVDIDELIDREFGEEK